MVQQRFEGKVVLVTGGGAGIGTGICKRFHAEGAKVWIVDTNREGAEAAAAALNQVDNGKEHARRAVTAIVDISQETAVSALLDQIEVTDGRLDVLVNNAARFVLKSAEMAEERDWDNVLASNVKGYGLVSKHAIRVMKATKTRGSSTEASGCSIINLGSISSFVGQPGMCTYSATKAAVLALTRCTAIDCGPYGIRVNAVCPGPILTEATKRHAASQGKSMEEMVSELTGHMIQHRMGTPAEIAAVVAFMASEDASFVSGASLLVDGGYSAL
ncbi:short-chain dehydrogenase reductase sdr [Nannochloropsis gaditana]|uniref:Short-chain dehydrogenase reductase sdr n=1 Tax=Nannochloropsis gaditana TaxID=72520 RepID=W7TPF3_9STRA|nr:short-chain dehydrogenase reductase sdr [Nannochloropsis gaditana]